MAIVAHVIVNNISSYAPEAGQRFRDIIAESYPQFLAPGAMGLTAAAQPLRMHRRVTDRRCNQGFSTIGTWMGLPKVGLEPTPTCVDRILSPARLPFRHFGPSGTFQITQADPGTQ